MICKKTLCHGTFDGKKALKIDLSFVDYSEKKDGFLDYFISKLPVFIDTCLEDFNKL